ncbi:MAG: hypothetical protein WHS44_10280 [Fimbriimonadales bacterium]|nr:MAG: hypothetical protein KatS3mg018_2205 [Fimbriimonadales bacterium]
MLIVYRIFWIVGVIALVAEMVILANPRQVAPQRASDWEIREQGRFRVRAPKQFRLGRDALRLLMLNTVGNDIRFVDALELSRGRRTGMQIVIVAPREQIPPSLQQGLPQNASAPNLNQFMRRAHDMYLAAMREDWGFVNFSETKRAAVRIRGVQGIRSDYEYTLPHPIPLFNMPVRGYLITLPLSPTEVIHFNAYCPPNSFGDYQKIFDQILATIEVRQESQNPFGGWAR